MTDSAEGPARPTEMGELLGVVKARFTTIAEYGIGFGDLLAGQTDMPPAGARFDVAYQGVVEGERLSGSLTGTDYLYIRGDGQAELHVHGRLTTPDGAHISLFAEAAGQLRPGEPRAVPMLEKVTLYSAFPEYAWVNAAAPWGVGTIDPGTGEILIEVYAFD